MMKKWLLISLFGCTSLQVKAAPQLGEYFDKYNEQSQIVINYSDVNQLFDMTVLELGMSDRKVVSASNSSQKTGTKLRTNRGSKTAFEANRFLYKQVKNSKLEPLIEKMRLDLQSLPEHLDLRELKKDEQLAYWLNLYAIGTIEKLMAQYPKYDLEDEILGKASYLDEKFIEILGQTLSLNDIKYNIVFRNYRDNPVVLYGFYQGNIGSPSLNSFAYTGKNVYKALGYLAREFINSNRGVLPARGDKIKISVFYEDNMSIFDNDIEKLRAHLIDYAKYDIKGPLNTAERLDFDIEAWAMADLDGGLREFGSSVSTNNAALLNAVVGLEREDQTIFKEEFQEGAFSGFQAVNLGFMSGQMVDGSVDLGRFTPSLQNYLGKLRDKYKKNQGTVEIKDLNNAEATDTP